MLRDQKNGVKYTKKRKFHGNQSVSRQSSVKKRRVESEASSTRVVDSDTDTEPNVSTTPPKVSDSKDTPTSSERKLQWMYGFLKEDKDVKGNEDDSDTDSEGEDGEIIDRTSVPAGNRIIL